MGKIPESLRLYLLCKNMKWTHLPVGGGLYDQHPKLLDDWLIIMDLDNKAQDRKMKEQERKSRVSSGSSPKRGRRGRR